MKLLTKETEARIGAIVLAAYVIAQLYYGKTFTFPDLTRDSSPGGFWFSVVLFSLLSLFLLIYSFLSKKKQNTINTLVNDTDIKDITGNNAKQNANK